MLLLEFIIGFVLFILITLLLFKNDEKLKYVFGIFKTVIKKFAK